MVGETFNFGKRLFVACLLVVAGIFVVASNATQAGIIYAMGELVTMEQLEDDGAIIAGDKQFSNFVYTPTVNAPSAAEVVVQGFYDDILQGYGLQFSGDFTADYFNGSSVEAGLAFTVEALDPRYLISDVHLDGAMHVFGDGSVSVIESFGRLPISIPGLAIRQMQIGGQSAPDNTTTDEIVFQDVIDVYGFRTFRVMKDIRARAGDDPFDEASVTTFTQVFTQGWVPEPNAITLMAIGLIGLALTRRRRP